MTMITRGLPVDELTRRGFFTASAAAAALILAGCSNGSPSAGAAGTTAIEHAHGVTQVPADPQRVVTLGFSDHDVLLALGLAPVGLRDWYGDHPNGVWPWAQDELGDARPHVLRGEDISFEEVAALEPDLILALYANLDEDQYNTLSAIASTIAQSGEHAAYATPWQEMTRTAGRAIGRQEAAEARIREVEERFARARDENPSFASTELVYAGAYGAGQVYVESARSTRFGLLKALGFQTAPEIEALVASDSFSADISDENLGVLDQGVLFWELGAAAGMREAIEAKPTYQLLDVVKDERVVYVDDPLLAGALAHATVLSLPMVLDRIVPMLAEATSR
ncbi:iron-siderophore ABC transporter substrate-binding protein [Lolliginicoccus suaedae]|uniref:iron-siderophore ABC transporter substrate-binding protein n=1 Tax=Lolliginicoccus suaedae TaxID=2605429 RepID=UPI0011EFA260|nr:iron-siderophore ABC transporter substrate-binding protein [Lolliginicoccus suaedae]